MKQLLLILFFLSVPLRAAEKVYKTRYTLPEVADTDIEGAPHKCLNVIQWQRVLVIANDYKSLYDWRLETLGVLAGYNQLQLEHDQLIVEYESIIKIHERDREYLNMRLNDEISHKAKLRLKNNIEQYVMWAVILAETIVIGVFGINEISK